MNPTPWAIENGKRERIFLYSIAYVSAILLTWHELLSGSSPIRWTLYDKNYIVKQLFSFAKDGTDGTEGMVPRVHRDHRGYQETQEQQGCQEHQEQRGYQDPQEHREQQEHQEHQVREQDALLLLFVTNRKYICFLQARKRDRIMYKHSLGLVFLKQGFP